jgi:FdhD protein
MQPNFQGKGFIPGTINNEPFHVLRCYQGYCSFSEHDLVGEDPLLIRVEDKPYSVIMRTPGEEIYHAAGFCLSEGIVDDADDLTSIGYCKEMDPNVVDIRLTPARCGQIASLLDRRGFISQTSCGICGREIIEEMCQSLSPVVDQTTIELNAAIRAIENLHEVQLLRKKTRGSHGVMLLDSHLQSLSVAEDVGRHNALDKAIGKLFMKKTLFNARIGVLSSRISYEMVQKAARARLSILLSISRPTALAVQLGKNLNMTLACTARESELIIFCGENRIIRE